MIMSKFTCAVVTAAVSFLLRASSASAGSSNSNLRRRIMRNDNLNIDIIQNQRERQNQRHRQVGVLDNHEDWTGQEDFKYVSILPFVTVFAPTPSSDDIAYNMDAHATLINNMNSFLLEQLQASGDASLELTIGVSLMGDNSSWKPGGQPSAAMSEWKDQENIPPHTILEWGWGEIQSENSWEVESPTTMELKAAILKILDNDLNKIELMARLRNTLPSVFEDITIFSVLGEIPPTSAPTPMEVNPPGPAPVPTTSSPTPKPTPSPTTSAPKPTPSPTKKAIPPPTRPTLIPPTPPPTESPVTQDIDIETNENEAIIAVQEDLTDRSRSNDDDDGKTFPIAAIIGIVAAVAVVALYFYPRRKKKYDEYNKAAANAEDANDKGTGTGTRSEDPNDSMMIHPVSAAAPAAVVSRSASASPAPSPSTSNHGTYDMTQLTSTESELESESKPLQTQKQTQTPKPDEPNTMMAMQDNDSDHSGHSSSNTSDSNASAEA